MSILGKGLSEELIHGLGLLGGFCRELCTLLVILEDSITHLTVHLLIELGLLLVGRLSRTSHYAALLPSRTCRGLVDCLLDAVAGLIDDFADELRATCHMQCHIDLFLRFTTATVVADDFWGSRSIHESVENSNFRLSQVDLKFGREFCFTDLLLSSC